MRGKLYKKPGDGDTRVIRRFLFFPLTLPVDQSLRDKTRKVYQRRWLEWALIRQTCRWPHDADMFTVPWVTDRWVD